MTNAVDVFLTDAEFEELVGREIYRIVSLISETMGKNCSACHGDCCRQINCALYSESFSSCPIYHIRPRECRYHFCNRILEQAPLSKEDKDLLMKPIQELCGGKANVFRLFTHFPHFPLDDVGLEALGIKEGVNSIIRDYESGALDETEACILLRELCWSNR